MRAYLVGKKRANGYQYNTEEAYRKNTFTEGIDDTCKKEKGKWWLNIPKLGKGQITFYPRLCYKDKSTFITVYIITKEKRKSDK